MFQFQFFQAPRKFLLGTFKEVVILWQRLRVEAREARWSCLTKVCNKWTPEWKSLTVAVQQGQSGFTTCRSLRRYTTIVDFGAVWDIDNHLQSSKIYIGWFRNGFHHLGCDRSHSEAWVLDDHRFSLRLLLGAIVSIGSWSFFFPEIWQKRMIWWWYGMMSISRAGKVRTWWKSHAWRDWPPKCMLRRAHPIKNIARHFKIQGDIHSGKLT